ncbi:ATP-dependent translocase ABCB1 [Coccinella septempunctata]|uniref:ATP-dependent translocase ABCB1 n=1 Tax=Coccinella septempunctata TaxID=41139 RepID=UPI001D07A088|nr:ATP-dependent translocase ABCB1 [Coccinella septempunctata]
MMDKFLLIIGIVATIAMAGVQPLNNLFYGDLTENIIEYVRKRSDPSSADAATDKFLDDIKLFAIQMGCIGFAMLILGYISMETFCYTSLRQIFKIRSCYTEKAMKQDISWYDQHQTGDFASKMSDDLNKLEEGLGEKIPMFLYMQAVCVSSLALAFFKGWELALVCLTSLPLSMICISIVSVLSTKLAKKESDAYGSAGAIAEEVLGTVRTVLAFGGQEKEIERYDGNLIFAKKNNIFRGALTGIGFGLLWFFMYCSYALAFWYGVGLVIDDKEQKTYTPGNMITVFFSVMNSSMNFGFASTYIEIFSKAKASGGKIFAIIDTLPVINLSINKGKKLESMKAEIKFKNVKFHYPTRKDVPILSGLNMEIKPGQTVALVGSSGCGKSTCIQMLQRFYDPISGQISIDGHDLKDLDLTWYRQKIAVVGQEPVLFGATIEDNIRYGNRDATHEDIVEATKKANAYDFISALPFGFKTVVGERGAQLSGGQKQRIAIARALVRNPCLLLLDEATSALDNDSESKVQAALDSASKGRTTIIVAHRLSTIRNADKIIVLSKGVLVEQGTHEELMALESEYYNLVMNQVVDKRDKDEENEENAKRRLISARELKSTVSVNPEDDGKFADEEESDEIESVSFLQVIKMNKPEWLQITMASIASIISGCSSTLFALLFGDIVGILSSTETDKIRDETNVYCYYFIAAGVVVGISTFTSIYFFGYAGELLTLRLRSQMFKAMLKQEIGWYDRKENGVGALCAKLAGEAALVQGATGQRLGTIVNSLATLILSIGLSVYYSWQLGLVTLIFTPFMLLAIFLQNRLMGRENSSSMKSLEKSTKVAVEAVSNVRTVASLGAEDLFHGIFMKELIAHQGKMLRNSHFKSAVFGFARGIQFFAYGTAMFYGGYLIKDGMDYDNVYKVSQALIMGTVTIANALSFSPNLQKGINAAQKALKLLNRVPKIADVPTANEKQWKHGTIDYSQIYFSYPTRPAVPVLKGLDLTILQGKTVALVGSSGCGKSTVIQLLERFYDPNSGSVSIDGEDLREIKLKSLRSHLGIVSQEPNLFDRTIGENIAYGDNTREVSKEEIIEAAKKANIHNFIVSLPLGYDTRLGEKGTQLSGGQKQRVAIARALIKNPKVLLLDEATSALDTESEKVVQEALDKAKEGRTCITIAHRLTTIQDADVICVVNKGKVAELGSHHELMQSRGLYYNLYTQGV